ncbi:MAG: flavodoxin [Chloroflexota bacterium]
MPTIFDHSDPRYLIVFANDEEGHNHAEEISLMLKKWVEVLGTAKSRFGVIQVNHAHEEHDDDEDHEHEHVRDEEQENAITAMATAFRRDNRARVNEITTGYATVIAHEIKEEQWETANTRTNQFANYMFGVRGQMFKDLDSAKAWLDEIADLDPIALDTPGQSGDKAATTAIFYGSTTGNTEMIAEQVQSAWQNAHSETPPIVNVGNMAELMKLLSYNKILVGIPTWNIGKLQDDWEIVYPYLDQVDLSGKTIAMFGIGDQYGYPENFQDALGILGRKFLERGAKLIGYTSIEGYEHSHSVGVDGDQFMGLAIDDINQPEMTNGRIEAWVTQVQNEFAQE